MSSLRAREHLLRIASEQGELLVARIRLALTAFLLLIPLTNLFTFLTPRERAMGFAVTLAATALSLVVYVLVRRDRGTPWLGMATSCLDVTLVSSQISRMILIMTASLLSAVVVMRTQELLRLSTRDPLTGLCNRSHFHERVAVEVTRARRTGQPLAIAMVDIDHFKSFNDQHGHAAGDEVLRGIARALDGTFRNTDIVGRYGGEEFVIAMPDTTPAAAGRKLEDVRQRIAATPIRTKGGGSVNVTISAGLAGFPQAGAHEEEVLAVADARLFEAKDRGRNRIVGSAV